MLTSFRQGIIQKNYPTLQLNNSTVDLLCDESFIATFAHGKYNYLHEEKENVISAWELNTEFERNYLFIKIDVRTGQRTFEVSKNELYYGDDFDSLIPNFSYFFNKKHNKCYFKNSNDWIESIVVLVGYVENLTDIQEYGIGSQVELNFETGIEIESGRILFSNETAIRSTNNKNGNDTYFLTNLSKILIQKDNLNLNRSETEHIKALAEEFIPKNYCVNLYGLENKARLSTRTDIEKPAHAVSLDQYSRNEVTSLIRYGLIYNQNFDFSEDPLTPLFLGKNGELTTTVPNYGIFQKVGYVIDRKNIFIDILQSFVIEQSKFITPSISITPTLPVSPSPTITPSITPSISESVTPTITPSISITPTLPVSPSPTITPSISITPTVTPSITPSESLVPSVSITPTVTPSITPSESLVPSVSITPSVSVTPSESPSAFTPFSEIATLSDIPEGEYYFEFTPINSCGGSPEEYIAWANVISGTITVHDNFGCFSYDYSPCGEPIIDTSGTTIIDSTTISPPIALEDISGPFLGLDFNNIPLLNDVMLEGSQGLLANLNVQTPSGIYQWYVIYHVCV